MYASGESTEEIAERFGYCVAGVRRVRQRFEATGSIEPLKTKRGRKPAFDELTLERIRAIVAQRPDVKLSELREQIGIAVNLSGYCRH